MGRLKVGVTGKRHYIVFTEALLKPMGYRSFADIVKSAMFDIGSLQNPIEVPCEVIDDTDSRIYESLFTVWPQDILDVVITFGRD